VKLGLAVWGETIAEQVAAAGDAEAAGLARVWTSELARSAFVPAAAIASATSTIGIGTAIALAFVRSPLTTALTTLDLAELSDGRFVLGLGTGVKRLNNDWHGVEFDPAARRLTQTVDIIRAVMSARLEGESIETDGDVERIVMRGFHRPHPRPGSPVPIHLAAVGPLMLRACGRVADGWIGHELGSPTHLSDTILPALDAGLAERGRSRGDLEVVASACCVLDDDPAQARELARPTVGFYASVRTYQPFFAAHGYEAQAVVAQKALRSGDRSAVAAAVTDEMVDEFCCCGPVDDVRRKLERYDGSADLVKLSAPTHDTSAADSRECQRRILELLT